MRRIIPVVCLFAAAVLCSGCGSAFHTGGEQKEQREESRISEDPGSAENVQEVSRDLFAMDTYMTVTAYGEAAEDAADAAVGEINRLDALFSVGVETSDIARLNHDKKADVSEETIFLIERSREISAGTGGAFDISVFPLMQAWGFTDGNYRIPEQAEIDRLLQAVDMNRIRTDGSAKTAEIESEETSIDLGAIAKGYTSAKLMDLFREYGLTSGKVSLGGNVQVLGRKPDGSRWRIGIEDASGEGLAGILETEDKAVITSGGYERYFEENGKRYHHILDPATGYPAESGLDSVTVVSADGTLADALATALFVMGEEEAGKYWKEHPGEFEMILQTEDGRTVYTEGLEGDFAASGTFEIIKQ